MKQREFCFSYTVTANTWTKVIKSIPGAAGLTISNDNALGAFIQWPQWWGTNYTSSGRSVDTWQVKNNASNYPDMTTTWYETNDATWELTGVQLEVGSQATAFEHRSFSEELALCERYFYAYVPSSSMWRDGYSDGNIYVKGQVSFPVTMRSAPSVTMVGTLSHANNETNNTAAETPTCSINEATSIVRAASSGRTWSFWSSFANGVGFTFSSEL